MGADISVEAVAGKLNRVGYEAFILGLRQAKTAGNRNIELGHWIFQLLQKDRTDISLTADRFKLNRARLLADATAVVNGFRKNETEMPGISNQVSDALDRGWHYATLLFGETQIRTGHLLVALLKSLELRRALIGVSQEFAKIPVDEVAVSHRSIWEGSDEGNLRPMDGLGVAAASAEGTIAAPGGKGTTALDRFSQDLTAKAKAGAMDPILGRDEEIRQIVDVLMRRRQNNPILTGEAGVGKTAVVEGFAQRIASGDVPPPLRGVKLCMLDVGLMQAGASMKGEFEQRLRSVIDEVQSSPTPIILFIDEAHTLIGAGRRRGHGRRGQSAQAGASARHAAHDRRHHLGRIPPVYREGSGADPALPADLHRRARCRRRRGDAARARRADGETPQSAGDRRGDRCGGELLQSLHSGAAVA